MKMISKWKKDEQRLRYMSHMKEKDNKKIRPVGLGLILDNELEDELALWYSNTMIIVATTGSGSCRKKRDKRFQM